MRGAGIDPGRINHFSDHKQLRVGPHKNRELSEAASEARLDCPIGVRPITLKSSSAAITTTSPEVSIEKMRSPTAIGDAKYVPPMRFCQNHIARPQVATSRDPRIVPQD